MKKRQTTRYNTIFDFWDIGYDVDIHHWINKTSTDYWDIEYDVDIHHKIPVLTSASASVNIGMLWWISRNIQYLSSQ